MRAGRRQSVAATPVFHAEAGLRLSRTAGMRRMLYTQRRMSAAGRARHARMLFTAEQACRPEGAWQLGSAGQAALRMR